MIGQGDVQYPVVVVSGTPYEMGFPLGRSIGREMQAFVSAALQGPMAELGVSQAVHAVPLLMPYPCSSIAAWGQATEDGHLYQTGNLDWSLAVKAHEFPVIVVYLPELGDAPAREKPYQVHAPHFTVWFRTLLYDADSLTAAVDQKTLDPTGTDNPRSDNHGAHKGKGPS